MKEIQVIKKPDKRVGKGKYWYYITRTECVLCGRIEETRERMYSARPENYWNRNTYKQDACGCHFL